MKTRILTALCALLLVSLSSDAQAVVWLVTNTAGTGAGSLGAAVDSANAGLAGVADSIHFAIPGAGPHVIVMSTSLQITAPAVRIDGYTQSGASVNTLAVGDNAVLKIVLTTDNPGIDAILMLADSCTIRGLAIGGDWNNAILCTGGVTNHVIEGNFIGLDASGTAALPNGNGIYVSSSNFRIGGTTPSARNVISGNTNIGIAVFGPFVSGSIQGNYLGTDKNGTSDFGNSGAIYVQATGIVIGGATAGAGNLISGNNEGIILDAAQSTIVRGNLIGTDATGLSALGNTSNGINMNNTANNTIGGTTVAARNVISANGNANISMGGSGTTGNTISGNYIGPDATGQAALTSFIGILMIEADTNLIGGSSAAERNVISANGAGAIEMVDSADVNTIGGNYIGIAADGVSALGNGYGINIAQCNFNQIGGTNIELANEIAFSTAGSGIDVYLNSAANRILRNSIHDNLEMGIDLGDDGPTPNDSADLDLGPNDLQNSPVITSIQNLDTAMIVSGFLSGNPGGTYQVEFFKSPSCDGSGFGEGEEWIGALGFDIFQPSGLCPFTAHLGLNLDPGDVLTATATNSANSTSEFSNCKIAPGPAVEETLRVFLFSPVSMVVTDPVGDSIGIDSASHVVFNTILNASSYDTTSDVNSPGLTGPDGSEDDIVTIPSPMAGAYQVRMFVSDTTGSSSFTMGIRIDGNQLLVPDDYANQSITALGNTVDPVFVWTAATTLPGDANADSKFTSADIIYLVNYVFKSGPATPVPGHGDANCSGTVTSADIIHMVNFVFKGGPPPCSQSGG